MTTTPNTPFHQACLSTGVAGLDDILGGGLPAKHLYLIEGTPGSGKTTLGMQFLMAGRAVGESGLYVTLSESSAELLQVAASHGWSLEGLELFDLISDEGLSPDAEQSVLHSSDMELGETTREIMQQVQRIHPVRVVFDGLSEMRLLAQNPLRYRRQVLALKQFFHAQGCTVLMLDDTMGDAGEQHLHSIAHGVIHLEQDASEYGPDKRRLRVVKLRGVKYRGGVHDICMDRGGIHAFPRLVAQEHGRTHAIGLASTGNAGLDALLGGGLSSGSNLLLAGPSGVGKTTTAMSCAVSAVERGERVAYFLFDEGLGTLAYRCKTLGMDLASMMAREQLVIRQLDPSEVSPGQFAHLVREAVETGGARMVVIDSLNAYLQSMPGGKFLLLQMHELLTYLNRQGVMTLMVLSHHGVMGGGHSDIDLSYLSDALVQFRYFEADGKLRKAVLAIKSRTHAHELSIREFRIGSRGIEIGEALADFEGVLSGVPRYRGQQTMLGEAS
jgi:circadian clock protein KaiC